MALVLSTYVMFPIGYQKQLCGNLQVLYLNFGRACKKIKEVYIGKSRRKWALLKEWGFLSHIGNKSSLLAK